jgi:ubiquitin C-terminal hydrolase
MELAVTGLQNLKNTCFINAAIQVLARIPALTLSLKRSFYFSSEFFATDAESLLHSFARLTTLIEAGDFANIKPVKFFEDLCRVCPMYSGKKQQDTQEFIRILLDITQTLLVESVVEDCFQGSFITEIGCSSCSYTSSVVESFLDLNLQIPKSRVDDEQPLSEQDARVIERVNSSWLKLL